MRRLLSAIGMLVVTGCGSVHAPIAAATPNSHVPWLPLPPAHQFVEAPPAPVLPPLPIPAGTPNCEASQLEGISMGEGAATGNVDMPILFRNRSEADCVLEGYADIAVLGARGKVLAESSGTQLRGTFFADGPVAPLLMERNTPALPKIAPQTLDWRGSRGQAFMNLSWYDCTAPRASMLSVGLPDGGGRFLMPFALVGDVSPACDNTQVNVPAVYRGPLTPVGIAWPPPPEYIKVKVDLGVPPSAHRGKPLAFVVTIKNTSDRSYDLRPCADYLVMFGDKQDVANYQLNCTPVARIAAGAYATFEMRVQVPATLMPGATTLGWYLQDGRIDAGMVEVQIRIT